MATRDKVDHHGSAGELASVRSDSGDESEDENGDEEQNSTMASSTTKQNVRSALMTEGAKGAEVW